MTADIDTRLAEAKQRVEREEQVRTELTRAREQFSAEAANLQRLENRVAELEQRIASLESPSLSGLWAAIAGKKGQQLEQYREELAAAERQYEACAQTVVKLDEEIQSLESALRDLEGAQKAYETLCQEKEALIIDGHDLQAAQLRNVIAEHESAADLHRRLNAAARTGNSLLERLHSLTNALGRASTKMGGSGHAGGMIGRMVTDAIGRKGASGAIDRARDGMKRFADEVAVLDFGHDTETAVDLAGLAASIACYVEELTSGFAINHECDMSAVRPMINDVQELVSRLEGMLGEINAEVKAIESERRELVAQACHV